MGLESLNILVILVSASKKKKGTPNRCHENETQSLLFFCTTSSVMLLHWLKLYYLVSDDRP